MIEIKVDDKKIESLLRRLAKKASDLSPVMREIAGIMQDAVEENFEQGGRPPWKPSRRAIEQGGQTLIDTGRLVSSISSRYSAASAEVAAGTNVEYAAIHQFGGKIPASTILPRKKKALFWPGAKHPVKRAERPQITIPARPFLTLTDKDKDEIVEVLREFLDSL
jgi:phage virion morphogenesis protein